MRRLKVGLNVALACLLAFGGLLGLLPAPAAAAANDYVTVTRSVNPTTITTEQEAEVTLNIKGTPPANVIVPNDVVLIIDKSGSMHPEYNNGEDKITNAKNAAKGFIDLMYMTKHRVGIVDFSSSTSIGSFDLTTDKAAAKAYIDTITANGATATGHAIDKAMELLANHRPEAQPVIVILTDGDATEPQPNPYEYAKQKAQEAKDAGIIFYTIALLRANENPDTSGPNLLLKEMATTADHHHFVLGSTGLADIYAAIVREIGLASAYDVTVTDTVAPEFEIVPGSYDHNIPKPTVNGNTLVWKFNELKDKTLTFSYKIRPINPPKTGTLYVAGTPAQVTYKDYAGAIRTKAIPNATLKVKYPAPEITSVVEPYGHPNGGNTVTINGNHFMSGATVTFGGRAATNVQVVNETQITATVPAGEQGTVQVVVTNPDKQSASATYQYKADPVITSIRPANGPLAGGNLVIFEGNYFLKGIVVKFGDQVAKINFNDSPTYLKVYAPAGAAPGPVDLTFLNPDGTSTVAPGGYTYDEPPVEKLEITTISPNSGKLAGGELVYLDGKKFDPNVKVYFGSNEAQILTYYSAEKLKVSAPASAQAGKVDVTVINPDGETFTLTGGYEYLAPPPQPAPTISGLTPTNGPLAGGTLIYIDGANFVNGLKVYFGVQEATVSYYYGSNKVRVVAPAASSGGKVEVKIVNPDGQFATKADAFEYIVPQPQPVTITSLTPNKGSTLGGEVITIDGTNFQSGAKVTFGTTTVSLNSYISSARITVKAPAAAAPGTVDVRIDNPDGRTFTLSQAYTYEAVKPTITAISPNHGPMSGGALVYIDGTNFRPDMTVTVNGNNVPINYYYGPTKIKIITPASGVGGPVPVVITLPNGQSASTTYTYDAPPVPAPTLTAMNTYSGPMAGGNLLYIDGTGFQKGIRIFFGSVEGTVLYYYGSTKIKVTAPAAAGPGPVQVKVVNPDGQESNTLTYTHQ